MQYVITHGTIRLAIACLYAAFSNFSLNWGMARLNVEFRCRLRNGPSRVGLRRSTDGSSHDDEKSTQSPAVIMPSTNVRSKKLYATVA